MVEIVRLQTRPERLKREKAAEIKQLLLELPGLPAQPLAALLNALSKATMPETGSMWPMGFTMVGRQYTEAVWAAIRALPSDDRPNQVRHAFDLVVLNLRPDNGEVMLTRDEMAAEIGCSPQNVSTIMGTLERIGAIRRERRKVEGMRGPGMAVYFVNPHVAWRGSLTVRQEAARKVEQPSLKLVQTDPEPPAAA